MLKDNQNKQDLQVPSVVAQKCPVCTGWGTVSYKRITCHACKGKGFILVSTLIDREKEQA